VSGRLPGLSSAGLLVSQVAHLDCAGPGEADALSRPVHMVRSDAMSGISPHRPATPAWSQVPRKDGHADHSDWFRGHRLGTGAVL